ncbi:UNVERIFIED_CONTAM: hypothetical protein Sindi_2852200 [Sesamum indicum]
MQTRSRARDVPDLDAIREAQANGMEQKPPGEQSVPQEKSRISSAPEEEEQRQDEVNSRISRPEVAQTQDRKLHNRESSAPPPPTRGAEDSYLLLAVAPPRRSPFASNILAEALPAGLKMSNLSEYDGTGDPQEHLDKFYAKIDWYDLSDAAYCKVFRTTLSKHGLEQLVQRFFHHFSMNKKVLKTAAYLFTIRQREGETLRDFMQRFKESIAGKPPSTMEDLLECSQKYIRIEESNAMDPSFSNRRVGKKRKSRRRRRNPSMYLQLDSPTIPL